MTKTIHEITLETLEVTKIEDVFVCNNCGAFSIHKLKNLKHFATCKKGESKLWEEYYSREETDDGEDIL